MRSHQKNPKSRLAQKLVGLATLVLLAGSFGPQPASGGQKSAAEVAKSKEAAGLEIVKEALTNAVATSFGEGLNGTKTKKFFEGWTDSDWESFLQKNPGFYAGASKLKAGDTDLEQLQLDLYKKHSTHLTGAIAETFHWVQWRKKLEQIAKNEKYTEVEFLDEKTLSKIFGNTGGQRCDGLAIAKKSGNPPKRVILGVFESKAAASQVKPIQIENFLVRIQDHYRNQGVSLIRLNDGQTKLIEYTEDSDIKKNIIEAAKSFHKEAAQFLTEEDSIHLLFKEVSSEFAGNVMGQTTEQKKKLFDESLPLKELAEFIRVNKLFPRQEGTLEGEQKLARMLSKLFNEHEEAIKAYLRGPGGVDEATLSWALEVKAEPWKKQLPDLAEFISVNKEFPNHGGRLDGEHKLGQWMSKYFPNEKKKPEILAYLSGPGGIDEDTLKWALEVKAEPWKKQLPALAEFIRDKKRFPKQNRTLEGEHVLATMLNIHFNDHEDKIKAYLIGRTDIDQAELEWMLEVRADPWKKQLPDLAEFIRDKKRFPKGGAASEAERTLAKFLDHYFKGEKIPVIDTYLEEHVDLTILQKAREDWENRKKPRKNKVPASDANPDLGECDEELKGILSGLTPAA